MEKIKEWLQMNGESFGEIGGTELYTENEVLRLLIKLSNELTPPEYKEWNTLPDKDGTITIPDHLDDLFNKVGMQVRFITISGKNEIQGIADIVRIADKFFNKK